ncbi:hypothetical protein GN958_ATG21888 [Phytophthora infestans]|uniref:Uncharacterized protein n=1 Tax=Phytophthora infestans TaxID=4787 RepID=A0A8S9TKA9_PHYIN|nr:hypothetical protein GN958_ATG21888 [Phytophthora infestans]
MADRRPDKEAFRLPPPSKTVSPSGRSMYAEPKSQQSKFDRYGSSVDVDVFIRSLPVNEMHDLHEDVTCCGKDESVHNYRWMLYWLDLNIELSKLYRNTSKKDALKSVVTMFDCNFQLPWILLTCWPTRSRTHAFGSHALAKNVWWFIALRSGT